MYGSAVVLHASMLADKTKSSALIDINSTCACRSMDACLTIYGRQTESMFSAVFLNIHRGVARNEVVDAICQVDRLCGFWKKDRGNRAMSKSWNVLIEIKRREAD